MYGGSGTVNLIQILSDLLLPFRIHLSGFDEPALLPLITYLLRIHNAYRESLSHSPSAPPELPDQDLIDRLLPSALHRDAAPLPPPVGSPAPAARAPPGARSADVQALIQCTGVWLAGG